MTAVVTGAAGHVGGNLVRVLAAHGHRVRALVHRTYRALQGLPVEIIAADVRDPESLRRAFAGAEVVFHTAAHISLGADDWPQLHAVNVVGTRNVVEACLAAGVGRLVHFSSIQALQQEPLDVPVDESRSLAEGAHCPPYDRSKAFAEREVREGITRGLGAIILNPTAVIGPYDFGPSHLGEALLAYACGRIPVVVPGGFDWVDVRDVVQAAVRAADIAPSGSSYLLSGRWCSVDDLARMACDISGVRGPRLMCPTALAEIGAPVAAAWARLTGQRSLFNGTSLQALSGGNHSVSHERAARELRYHPRPLEQTLLDTLQWFAEQGMLSIRAASRLSEAV